MQQKYSTFNYIAWSVLTLSIGFAVVGFGFKSSEKIFAYTDDTSSPSETLSPIEPEIPPMQSVSPITAPESIPTQNLALQEALRDAFTEKYLTASAYQASLPVDLIDTDTFHRGSCPASDTDDYPYYSRTDMNDDLGNYIPSYLVEIQSTVTTKEDRTICLDETAAFYLDKMLQAAQADGHDIVVTSGFRDHVTQKVLYKNSLKNNPESAYLHVAKPGHSEHQLGLAVDLAGASMNYDSASSAFGNTPEGLWLQKNAHEYGFVMSYQEGAEEETGIIYEPWHWRFVGTTL